MNVLGLTNLVKLKRIYLERNFIEKIEGLDTLVNLELLQLETTISSRRSRTSTASVTSASFTWT